MSEDQPSSSRQHASNSYYSSASSRDGRLPSIREVVGDVLQQPVRPYESRSYSLTPPPLSPAFNSHPPYCSSSSSHIRRESSLQRYASNSLYPRAATPSPSHHHRRHSSNERHPTHSYDVFVSNPAGSLIHKRSSTVDDFSHVPKEDAIASSTGKHVCPECGRRFEKLSTLKNHLTTHSGEKPHVCPECGKSFSVSSNMRRHQLIHRGGGSSR